MGSTPVQWPGLMSHIILVQIPIWSNQLSFEIFLSNTKSKSNKQLSNLRWHNGAVVRAAAWQQERCRFDSRPGSNVTNNDTGHHRTRLHGALNCWTSCLYYNNTDSFGRTNMFKSLPVFPPHYCTSWMKPAHSTLHSSNRRVTTGGTKLRLLHFRQWQATSLMWGTVTAAPPARWVQGEIRESVQSYQWRSKSKYNKRRTN